MSTVAKVLSWKEEAGCKNKIIESLMDANPFKWLCVAGDCWPDCVNRMCAGQDDLVNMRLLFQDLGWLRYTLSFEMEDLNQYCLNK